MVNGVPKSGTHAFMALLDRMGLKRCPGTILPIFDYLTVSGAAHLNMAALRAIPDNVYILGHVPTRYDLQGFRVITVFRDPRNCLVSYIRHRKREEGLHVSIPEALESYWDSGPFVAVYQSYLGWRGRSLVVRYEDIPADVAGDGSGIYAGQARDWNTRTGEPSRWQDWWDAEAEAAWIAYGGLRLLVEAGYRD